MDETHNNIKTLLQESYEKKINAKDETIQAFEILMKECKTGGMILMVVCLGAGDAFKKRYWPILKKKAEENTIKLVVVDNNPLSEELTKEFDNQPLYFKFIKYEVGKNYSPSDIFKPLINDKDWYVFLKADIVFVLVPDNIHIMAAAEWLKRAKAIFVEKPYDSDPKNANNLNSTLEKWERRNVLPSTIVIPFDHYLGKMAPFLFEKNMNDIIDHIGSIEKIDFSLTENWPIERDRADSLTMGMIFDLFCHILAIIHPFVDIDSITDLKTNVARHHGSLIGERETFAEITFTANSLRTFNIDETIDVKGCVGKGIGRKEEKWLDLIGDDAKLRLDFKKFCVDRTFISKSTNTTNAAKKIADLGDGHTTFLNAIFNGEYINKPVGGLTRELATKILDKLHNTRALASAGGKLSGYRLFSSIEEINQAITDKEKWDDPKRIIFDAKVLDIKYFPATKFNCSHKGSCNCWIWSIVKLFVLGNPPDEFKNVIPNYGDTIAQLDIRGPVNECVFITNNDSKLNDPDVKLMSVVFVGDQNKIDRIKYKNSQTEDKISYLQNLDGLENLLKSQFLKGFWVPDKNQKSSIPYLSVLENEIADIFKSVYQKDRKEGVSEVNSKTLESLKLKLHDLKASGKDIRWLDMGCGDGRCLEVLDDIKDTKNIYYHGIDISPTFHNAAEMHAKKYVINYKIEEMNTASMIIPSEYDLVSAVLFLHEVDPLCLPYVIRNMLRALKSDGTLVISDFEGPYEQEKEVVSWGVEYLEKILSNIGVARMSGNYIPSGEFPKELGFYWCYVKKPEFDDKRFDKFIEGYSDFMKEKKKDSRKRYEELRRQINENVCKILKRTDIDTKNISNEDKALLRERMGNEYGIKALKIRLLINEMIFLDEKIGEFERGERCKGVNNNSQI